MDACPGKRGVPFVFVGRDPVEHVKYMKYKSPASPIRLHKR